MNTSLQMGILLLLALLAANLPFLSQRLLIVGPRRHDKPLSWRLLELMLLYVLTGLLGLLLEQRAGQVAPQGWEFYAITAALFLTLAFPGFVYRQLLHRRD